MNQRNVKIGILGVAGRMGQMLAREVLSVGAELAGGCESAGHPNLGKDIGNLIGTEPLALIVGSSAEELFQSADVVIDFSTPTATLAHLQLAQAHRKALVIGTTGIDPDGKDSIQQAAQQVPLVFAANYSLGVTLLSALVKRAAQTLGEAFDIEIVEMHHRHKVDAPSGTALALGEAAAAGRQISLADQSVMSRVGHTGARTKGSIGFATLRGGDVVGDHQVIFAAEGERLELGHRASDRRIFARGAVRAAIWLVGQQPGLYDMFDVLDLKS